MPSLPGPRDHWLGLKLAHEFTHRPLDFLNRLARDYGDVAFFRLGPFRVCLVNQPELIREVLVTQRTAFPKHRRHAQTVRSFSGNSVFVAEGSDWVTQRRMVQPAFQPRRMEAYVHATLDETRRMLAKWEPNSELDLVQAMSRLALLSIGRALFRVDLSDRADEIAKALRVHSTTLRNEFRAPIVWPDFFPTPAKGRKRWAVRYLHELIMSLIRKRWARPPDGDDVLSILMAGGGGESGGPVPSDQQICDEARVLFIAGQDDTTAALSWSLFLLATHPNVEARCRDEIKTVSGGRDVTFEQIGRLSYTEMVVKETLRLYPPTWCLIPRVAASDVTLGGYSIRRGTWVLVSPYATHHDQRFFPQPDAFVPERFSPARQTEIPAMAYIPFGGGPRACVGNAYSLSNIVAMIAAITQRHGFSICDDPKTVLPDPSLALRPKGGVRVRLKSP